jgi:hypothetical protein
MTLLRHFQLTPPPPLEDHQGTDSKYATTINFPHDMRAVFYPCFFPYRHHVDVLTREADGYPE